MIEKNEKIMFAIQFISFQSLHTSRRFINGKITHPKSVLSNAIQKKEGNSGRDETKTVNRSSSVVGHANNLKTEWSSIVG